MDDNLVTLDARLGALELLVRNLYAHRFAAEDDPVAAAEKAAKDIENLAERIKVAGSDAAMNDLLAAEAREFLVEMFREILEIVKQSAAQSQPLDLDATFRQVRNREISECPPFQRASQRLRRIG